MVHHAARQKVKRSQLDYFPNPSHRTGNLTYNKIPICAEQSAAIVQPLFDIRRNRSLLQSSSHRFCYRHEPVRAIAVSQQEAEVGVIPDKPDRLG